MKFAPLGPYDQFANRLIERGYAVIPIVPGTKKPGRYFAGMWIGLSNWQRRFNGGFPSVEELTRWGEGNAGIGVLGGYRGLIAVDIDTDDVVLRNAIMSTLPPSPVRKTGLKGETLFYHGPDVKSQSWDINNRRVVDLIGSGRQTVLPPTVHPSTRQPYRWTGPEALDDLAPEDLPELPADVAKQITATLKLHGYRPEPPPQAGSGTRYDGYSPHRQLNDAAMANLAAWVPALNLFKCRPARGGYEAVPTWRPSTTGRPTDKRHLNLKISPLGIKDFGADQGYTPLDLVMAADGCDLDTAFRFLSERLTFGVDIDVSALVPPKDADGNPVPHDPVTGEVTDEPQDKQPEAKPEPEPRPKADPKQEEPAPAGDDLERFTHVPGAVGEIINWITATARRPTRVPALGAAITIVGTLIGRRVAGPTRSATHLYVVAIAPPGSGKQHPMNAALCLMRAAKAEAHIGPSKFFSLSAVQKMLNDKPLALCIQDEIGVFLKSVTSAKASSHEKAASQMLRTLWGISFAAVPSAQWATQKMSLISCPAVSVFGVSTPDEFLSALQGESVANGFLSRFLVLNCGTRASDADPAFTLDTVPASLADTLHRLYVWSGPESLLQIADPEAVFVPDILPWASEQARACYTDFTRLVEQYTDDHPETAAYLARCAETSIRLATIRAAGRWERGAKVDLADMEWGAGIAWTAGKALATAAQDFLPQNERGELTDKIARLIRRRGLLKVRDIQQYLRGRTRSPEIKDILGQLVEADEIEWTGQGYVSKATR